MLLTDRGLDQIVRELSDAIEHPGCSRCGSQKLKIDRKLFRTPAGVDVATIHCHQAQCGTAHYLPVTSRAANA